MSPWSNMNHMAPTNHQQFSELQKDANRRRQANGRRVTSILTLVGLTSLFLADRVNFTVFDARRSLSVQSSNDMTYLRHQRPSNLPPKYETYTEEWHGPSMSSNRDRSGNDGTTHDLLWNWSRYSQNKPFRSRRLLIAAFVDTTNDVPSREIAATINKAYAYEWNVDYVTLQYSSATSDDMMYFRKAIMRLRLLFAAVEAQYDNILLLDGTSMMMDMQKDVVELMPSSSSSKNATMVVAPKLFAASRTHTFRIHSHCQLWNVQQARTILKDWYEVVIDVDSEINRNYKTRYLQYVLRHHTQHVQAVDTSILGSPNLETSYVGRYDKDIGIAQMKKDATSICKSHATRCKLENVAMQF